MTTKTLGSNVVELRPGGLSADEMETVETIALMLLRVEDVRRRLKLTTQPLDDLVALYGPPEVASHAFRFPVVRWSRGDAQWIAIDQGRVRITVFG